MGFYCMELAHYENPRLEKMTKVFGNDWKKRKAISADEKNLKC